MESIWSLSAVFQQHHGFGWKFERTVNRPWRIDLTRLFSRKGNIDKTSWRAYKAQLSPMSISFLTVKRTRRTVQCDDVAPIGDLAWRSFDHPLESGPCGELETWTFKSWMTWNIRLRTLSHDWTNSFEVLDMLRIENGSVSAGEIDETYRYT